jgi:large subunit ribosomal protein L11
MSKEKIDLMVEGGKAAMGPAVAQKLGPLKINMGDVLKKVNEKTSAFKGMQVPVKLTVDTETKEVEVEVGTPPTCELIKKELKLEKGSGEPNKKKVANMSIEQVIKVAKMKQESFFTNNLKSAVKCVIGSANSLGILVEGKTGEELVPKINGGKFKEEIEKGETETSPEKAKNLDLQLKQRQIELDKEFAKLEAAKEEEKKEEPKEEEKKEEPKEGEAPKEGKEAKPEEKKEEAKKE